MVVDENYSYGFGSHVVIDDRGEGFLAGRQKGSEVAPSNDRRGDEMSPEVRWGVGCLVGAAAITGMLILLMYIAFTFEPPLWVQLVLAVGLTIGGGLLTWIVVTALGESKARSHDADSPEDRVVERFPDPPPPG